MTRHLLFLLAALVLLPFAAVPHTAAGGERKPNIVFIMADDLGYGELGCYGQQKIRTPHIDRLAREGMRFTNYYAGSTVCAPSRSVLMTGLHTGHTRVRGNGSPAVQSLREEDVTVPKMLKKAGYATGITGKWGLGDVAPGAQAGLPNRQGFDYFFGYLHQVHAHNYWPSFLYRNDQRVELPNQGAFAPTGAGVADVKKTYAPDLMLEEALNFIEQQRSKPFFLYLAWTLPHANNEANRQIGNGTETPALGEYRDTDWSEPNKGHAAMVTYLDTQVGRVLDKLERAGLKDDTLVIFTSDNGPHREAGNNPAFFDASGAVRGIKRDLYDGGIRVPMIVRWPGRVRAGSETDHIAYHGDLMATAAEIAGFTAPAGLDSLSYAPTLLGKGSQAQHPYLYWEFYEDGGRQAVRLGHWKAVREPMFTGPVELYNVRKDPKERSNVAAEHPEAVKQAEAAMQAAHIPSPDWKVRPKRPAAQN